MTKIEAFLIISKAFPKFRITYLERGKDEYWFNVQNPDRTKAPRGDTIYRLDLETKEITQHHKNFSTGEIE